MENYILKRYSQLGLVIFVARRFMDMNHPHYPMSLALQKYVGEDWKQFIIGDKEYHRHSLLNTKDFEIALIEWSKNQPQDLHTHNYKCAFVVLDGEIKHNKPPACKWLRNGESDFIDVGKHHCINTSDYGYTLHTHFKPKIS